MKARQTILMATFTLLIQQTQAYPQETTKSLQKPAHNQIQIGQDSSEKQIVKSRMEVINAAIEYKLSLEKLLTLQEADLRNAVERMGIQEVHYEQNKLDKRQLDESKQAVAVIESKIKETKSKIAETDRLLAEVVSELSQSHVKEVVPFVIGPESVWKASKSQQEEMVSKCTGFKSDSDRVSCFSSMLRSKGASPGAVAFARFMKGRAFLLSFKEAGKVDVGHLFISGRVNDNVVLAFLNGEIKVAEVASPCCDAATDGDDECDCPEDKDNAPSGWHPEFQEVGPRPGGGQRFVIREEERRCHACQIESYIYNGYDFDEEGKFIGSRFLYERPVRTLKGQEGKGNRLAAKPKKVR